MSGLDKFDRKRFYSEVYNIVQQIPAGRVLTYGIVARLAGFPNYSRLTGQALAQAHASLHLPCHRVVNSQGRIAPNWPEQQKLLEAEKVIFKSDSRVDLKKSLWKLLTPNS